MNFCILRELIFAIVKDSIFLLGINFYDLQEVDLQYFIFLFFNYMQSTSETTCRDVKHGNQCQSVMMTSYSV